MNSKYTGFAFYEEGKLVPVNEDDTIVLTRPEPAGIINELPGKVEWCESKGDYVFTTYSIQKLLKSVITDWLHGKCSIKKIVR